jgi:hypothetical protein
MKRKRVERTRELRSSWFYGNDLGEPGDGDHDEGNEAEVNPRLSRLDTRF